MRDKLWKGGVEIADEKYLLKVSKDKLKAILVPKGDAEEEGGTQQIDNFEALRAEIEGEGVVFGLLPEPELLENGAWLVAKGEPAENGENATVKAHVNPSVVRAPKMKDPEKDRVDYRELGSIVNVVAEQLLLEKKPPTEGKPGKNVLDVLIQPKAGKDIRMKSGPGVTLSEDGLKLFSKVDGKFVMADGKPCVFSEHIVNSDIDMSIGNITFIGKSLVIQGAVLPGFKVKCRGDISIARGINNAIIMAGGNIDIKGGILGPQSKVLAKGDIFVDFVENGPTIETKSSLNIVDVAIQANVRVGKELHATKGKGIIIGGKYVVAGSMHVKELGSDAEIKTEVSVGINPELEERKRALAENMEIWPKKMSEILKNLSTLKQMKKQCGGKLPPDKVELMNKLNGVLPQVMEQVNNLTEEEEKIKAELDVAIDESVYVYNKAYPNVIVSIGKAVRTLTAEEQAVVIHMDKSSLQIHLQGLSEAEMEEAVQQ